MSSYSVWLKDGEENTRLFDVDINNGDTSTRNALMAYKKEMAEELLIPVHYLRLRANTRKYRVCYNWATEKNERIPLT